MGGSCCRAFCGQALTSGIRRRLFLVRECLFVLAGGTKSCNSGIQPKRCSCELSSKMWPSLAAWQIKLLSQAKCVENVAAIFGVRNLTTTDEELPEDAPSVYFASNAGIYFGVPALLGRMLIPSDAPEGQGPQPVAVLSYAFWQKHFNLDPAVVGKKIQVVHKTYSIVGVMPKRVKVSFSFRKVRPLPGRYGVVGPNGGVGGAARRSATSFVHRCHGRAAPRVAHSSRRATTKVTEVNSMRMWTMHQGSCPPRSSSVATCSSKKWLQGFPLILFSR